MSMIVVGNLLLASGCCWCWPERPWFGRRCCNNGSGMECCGMTPGAVSEGPILTDAAPPTCAGPPGTILNAPAPTTAPQLSPPPRLTPQPAQTMPYQPTKRIAS